MNITDTYSIDHYHDGFGITCIYFFNAKPTDAMAKQLISTLFRNNNSVSNELSLLGSNLELFKVLKVHITSSISSSAPQEN